MAKFNIGSLAVEDKPIMSNKVKAIMVSKPFAADNGSLDPGLLVAENASRAGIPAVLVEGEEMTGTVNGTNDDFTYAHGRAICPGSVVVAHGVQELQDDGCGNLVGNGSGTVNYRTGAVAATLTTPPAESSGQPTIDLADDPYGVLCESIDTDTGDYRDTGGQVAVFGSAIFANIFVSGGDAVPVAMVDRLRVKGVYVE